MQRDPRHMQRPSERPHSSHFSRRRLVGAGIAAAGLATTGPLRSWAAPARQEPVALKFITLGEAWAEHMQEVIDAFEAANPGITVEMETYPFRQLFEIIEVRMAGQSSDVDLISVDVPLVASYSVRGFLHPLDAYFTPEEMEGTWVPASVDAGIYNDQFMAAPQNSSTQFLYINRQLFTDAGVEPPPAIEDGAAVDEELVNAVVEGRWTWEQVVEAAQALTADTNGDGAPDTWGVMFDQVSRPYQILALPESLNQPSVSEDGLQLTATSTPRTGSAPRPSTAISTTRSGEPQGRHRRQQPRGVLRRQRGDVRRRRVEHPALRRGRRARVRRRRPPLLCRRPRRHPDRELARRRLGVLRRSRRPPRSSCAS